MRRVVLLGFRGTGKSAVGRRLSEMLGVPFHDTDAVIEERAGKTIPRIFAENGEEEFRRMEREVVETLPAADAVVSTGGGIVMDPANVESLRRHSTCILLQASPEAIVGRIRESNRPALTDLPLEEEVREMLRRRSGRYIGAADFCVDTTARSTAGTARAIARILARGAVRRSDAREGLRFLEMTGLCREDLQRVEGILRDPDQRLTRLYAIVGYPCAHSRSPPMYNRLFARYGLGGFYTRIEWPSIGDIMRAVQRMDFRGLSVTIPFKADAVPYLDVVDEHAAAIGAVNTVVRCGGAMYGYNTDWLGIQRPIAHLKGSRAVLLGGGGAAAAAAYAMTALEMDVTILNRTVEKARGIAERFGCRAGGLEEIRRIPADLVVNATSVGMEPDTRTLLTAADLRPGCTVFDLVYTPPVTPLLREAKAAGCATISGREMFVHQAREQFEVFTGIRVPEQLVREAIPP